MRGVLERYTHTRAWNFILGDETGHEIDFIVLDEDPRGVYGPANHGDCYPAEALVGTGTVNDRPDAAGGMTRPDARPVSRRDVRAGAGPPPPGRAVAPLSDSTGRG